MLILIRSVCLTCSHTHEHMLPDSSVNRRLSTHPSCFLRTMLLSSGCLWNIVFQKCQRAEGILQTGWAMELMDNVHQKSNKQTKPRGILKSETFSPQKHRGSLLHCSPKPSGPEEGALSFKGRPSPQQPSEYLCRPSLAFFWMPLGWHFSPQVSGRP